MLDRRCWLSGLIGGALLPTVAARASQSLGRPFRIGWLSVVGGKTEAVHSPIPPPMVASPVGQFVRALGDLGYADGRDFVLEFRSAQGVLDRLPRLAAELVEMQVDVIVAVASASSLAASRASRTIPIIMLTVPDPVGDGLVASLSHPGGNVTGLMTTAGDLVGKMLQILKEVVPGLSRVGLLLSAVDPIRAMAVGRADSLGLVAVAGEYIRRPEDIGPAFAAMVGQGAQAFVSLASSISFENRWQVCELALTHRLAGITVLSEFADAGLLMSLGPSLTDLHRRAAWYVDKILKGAKPADMPVEAPTRFDLVINLRTARAIGVTISPALRLRADRMIE